MPKKLCPNCDYDISGQDLDETPHCPGCGANLKVKKYTKREDPTTTAKELEDAKKRLAAIEKEHETIKKTLQEKDDHERERSNEPKRTLFGN